MDDDQQGAVGCVIILIIAAWILIKFPIIRQSLWDYFRPLLAYSGILLGLVLVWLIVLLITSTVLFYGIRLGDFKNSLSDWTEEPSNIFWIFISLIALLFKFCNIENISWRLVTLQYWWSWADVWNIIREIFWATLADLSTFLLLLILSSAIFFITRYMWDSANWLTKDTERVSLIFAVLGIIFLAFADTNAILYQLAGISTSALEDTRIPLIEPVPTPTPTPIPEKKTYETTWQDDEHIRALDQNGFLGIGSMHLDYRYDEFSVAIEIPREYNNLGLSSFERISLPFDNNNNKHVQTPIYYILPRFVQYPADCFYSQNILVYPIIDAQLTSEDFEITSFEPDTPKILDITNQYPNVSWEWIIKIRDYYSSKGSISLSLFLDEISEPSWSCTFLLDLSR